MIQAFFIVVIQLGGLFFGVFGCYQLIDRNMNPVLGKMILKLNYSAVINYLFMTGKIDPEYQAGTTHWIMGTAEALFSVLISSLLISGASQRRRDLILPWLVAEAIIISKICFFFRVKLQNIFKYFN